VVSVFAPDAARALGGPDWLRLRRVAAAERVSSSSLPTTEEEVWRYSRINELDLDRYRLGAPAPTDLHTVPRVRETLAHYDDCAAVVVMRNGRIVQVERRAQSDQRRGLFVGSLADHPDGASLLGSASPTAVDLFAEMNNAFAADPIAIVVEPNFELTGPVVVVHWNDGDGTASFPRLVVRAGANSQATIVEHYLSSDEPLLVAPAVELVVQRDARLAYVNVQQLGAKSWQLASQSSTVDAGATFSASAAAFGGESARQRTDCRLVGRGATGLLHALYFGNDEQLLDFRTFQDHAARDTTSNLLFKGVVDDRAKAVYTGLIHVRPDARGTNAFQTNRNIKLSDDAWAESVPNLQIENNDVKCSHASTVGPVDEDQRFYLESRGLHPSQAERFIVAGFFDEVLDAMPAVAARTPISLAISRKLPQENP
jgi:Fe-S cluster assembly protein SufD